MKVTCSIVENFKTWNVLQNKEIVKSIQQYLNYLCNLQKNQILFEPTLII